MFKILRAMFSYVEGPIENDKHKYFDYLLLNLNIVGCGFLILEIIIAPLGSFAHIYGISLSSLFDKKVLSGSTLHLVLFIGSIIGTLFSSIILTLVTDNLRDNLRLNKCPMILIIPAFLSLAISCLMVFVARCLKKSWVWVYNVSTLKEMPQNKKNLSKSKTIS